MVENERLKNRREFLATTAAGAGALLLGDSAIAGNGHISAFDVGNKRGMKILAVTDLHFFAKTAGKDERTIADIKKMAGLFGPDLLVVNGDVWHDNPDGRGVEFCKFACDALSGVGLPWVFVRGNHDIAENFAECEAMLAAAPGSLYKGLGSDSNYTVEVISNGEVAWRFFAVNDSAPEKGFQQKQIDWLQAETGRIKAGGSVTPSFLFCHVPIPQFKDVVVDGKAKGVMREGIYFEEGSRDAFSVISDSGFIKAVFCGHDHLNDYDGELFDVRLDYLRSTGSGGYGGLLLKKGGTIIDVDLRGSFEATSVFPDGKTWRPKRTINKKRRSPK
jgi:calcineurin-like phosphoesterase family protein